MRKYNQPTTPAKGRKTRLAIIIAMLVFLTACRPVSISTASLLTESQTSRWSQSSASSAESATTVPESQTNPSYSETSAETSTETSAESTAETSESQSETESVTAESETGAVISTARNPTSTPTAKPTAKPTAAATTQATTAAGGSFPYRDYGTFYRNNYGQNSNIITSDDGGISIDIGSAPYGVALVKVDGIPEDKRCKVIATGGGKTYQYDILTRGKYMGIPLQNGNGSYTITVYEQTSGTSYIVKMAHTFSVTLASSLKPFTAASVMVDFSSNSACVVKANSLCSGINTANGRVDAVYRWIVANISYDRALADSITSGQVTTYIPNPDQTYSTKKGICFEYASLMCAMLRSQGIPTRLVVGQTKLGYHAWNEVYFEGTGWVVVASFKWQEINGSGWVMFDSTFAAGGMSPTSIQDTTHTKQKTY